MAGKNNKGPKPTNVFSKLYPDWVLNENVSATDNDFQIIVDFYLIHSLCDGQSWKKNSLQETYAWKNHPWKPSSYLKDKIVKAIWSDEQSQLYMADKREDFQLTIQGKALDDKFTEDISSQRAGYVKSTAGKGNDNLIMSLFYHIRNALAHGRFGLKQLNNSDYMVFLEDGSRKNHRFEVNARIALKKSSLLSIKRIIENGPDDDPNYGDEIFDSIKRGNHTRNKIMKDTGIENLKNPVNIWKREIDKLKRANKIHYDNNKWLVVEEEDKQ